MTELFTAEQFIKAIPGTGGIVSLIAKKVGCTWHTARKYIDRYATVQQAWRDECEAVLDLAETQAIGAIRKGDPQMVRWYLATKGKQRGYTERHEVTGAEGGAVRVIFDETAEWRGGNPLSGAEAASGAKDSL